MVGCSVVDGVTFYHTMWHHITEGSSLSIHCLENLRSCIVIMGSTILHIIIASQYYMFSALTAMSLPSDPPFMVNPLRMSATQSECVTVHRPLLLLFEWCRSICELWSILGSDTLTRNVLLSVKTCHCFISYVFRHLCNLLLLLQYLCCCFKYILIVLFTFLF